MKLLSATVRNYRIHRECKVEFDAAVTLLVGPNETGKTTLLEAVHRALLLHYRNNGKERKAMLGPDQADPEIEVDFEAKQAKWHLRKVFKGSPSSVCQLRNLATGVTRDKDEAQEELLRLLGRDEAPKTEKQLAATWSHLWAWQGKGGEDVLAAPDAKELFQALARRDASGTVGGMMTALENRVHEAAKQAVDANWTPTKGQLKADGETKRKQAAAQELLEQCADARAKHATRSQQRDQLVQLRANLAANGKELATAEAQVSAAGQRVAALQTGLAQQASLEDRQAHSNQRCESLAKEVASRGATAKELQRATALHAEAVSTATREETEVAVARHAVDAAVAAATQAEAQRHGLALKQRAVANRRSLCEAESRAADLQQSVQSFAAATAAHAAAQAAAQAAIEVTPDRLEELRQFEAEVRNCETRLDAAAARILVLTGPGTLHMDGEAIAIGTERRIDRPTRIVHSDGTALEVRPGGSDVSALRERFAQANDQLHKALLQFGVKDLAGAVALEEHWRGLQRQVDISKSALASLPDPGKELPVVRIRLEQLRSLCAADPLLGQQDTEEQVAADHAAADSAHRAAVSAAASARKAEEAARTQAKSAQDALGSRRREVDRHQGNLNASHDRFGSDEVLQARLQEAENDRQDLGEQLAVLAQQARNLQDERTLQAGFERGRNGLRDASTELERQIHYTEGALGDHSADTAATLEQLSAEHARAAAQADAATLRANADKLLLEKLEAAQSAMSTRRQAPFLDACARYLALAFGDGSRLHILGQAEEARLGTIDRTASGLSAHDFEQLSCGGQELVALAARLAMAEVLAAEQHETIPVVLDDALSNVDPTRAQRIGGMLTAAAAAKVQILAASCDEERSGLWQAGKIVRFTRP